MIEILTSKNKYNYTIKQILIDYELKTFEIKHGGASKIAPKNATTKRINETAEKLRAAGFVEVKN